MSDLDAVHQPLLPSASTPPAVSAGQQEYRTGLEGRTMAQVARRSNLSRSAIPAQGAAIAFAALVWAWMLNKLPSPLPTFGYHPLIQSLGLVLLTQSLLVLQPTTTPASKKAGLKWHQIFNLLLVLPLFTAGASIMYYLHDQPGQKHFISWHGTLGFVVVIYAWFQAAIGAASVWFKGALVGGEIRGKALWKYHRLSGYLLLSLFLVTFVLAILETTWSTKNGSILQHGTALALVAVLGASIFARVNTNKLPKLK